MYRYVVGLAFSADHRAVLLLRKNRPKWQASCLNGPGGKAEPGEDYLDAMVREFEEETGLTIPASEWKHVLVYRGPDYELNFYRTFTDRIYEAQSMTDEPLVITPMPLDTSANVIKNLRWIIPLCLDPYVVMPLEAREI